MKVLRKRSVWFKTELGYGATKENIYLLADSSQKTDPVASGGALRVDDWSEDRGRFSIYPSGMKDVTLQVTTKGNFGIHYPDSMDLQEILEKVKPLLLRPDGSPAREFTRKTPTDSNAEESNVGSETEKTHNEVNRAALSGREPVVYVLVDGLAEREVARRISEYKLKRGEGDPYHGVPLLGAPRADSKPENPEHHGFTRTNYGTGKR